jgi:hypothetical protein
MEPMESPEGQGIAHTAWDEAAQRGATLGGRKLTLIQRLLRKTSLPTSLDLWGFWLVWHLHGGFDGLRRLGMSRSAIYRRVKDFRTMMGVHPDEFVMPGVSIDVTAYRSVAYKDAAGKRGGGS